jgi:hypothetical protein
MGRQGLSYLTADRCDSCRKRFPLTVLKHIQIDNRSGILLCVTCWPERAMFCAEATKQAV